MNAGWSIPQTKSSQCSNTSFPHCSHRGCCFASQTACKIIRRLKLRTLIHSLKPYLLALFLSLLASSKRLLDPLKKREITHKGSHTNHCTTLDCVNTCRHLPPPKSARPEKQLSCLLFLTFLSNNKDVQLVNQIATVMIYSNYYKFVTLFGMQVLFKAMSLAGKYARKNAFVC